MGNLKQSDLGHFTGSMEWTRWAPQLFPRIIASEGMIHVAEEGGEQGAYWLLDAIASHEQSNPDLVKACVESEAFDFLHFWKLEVNTEEKTAVLTCVADTGEEPVVTQEIEYTDFQLPELTVYAGNDGPGTYRKLFLPSEY